MQGEQIETIAAINSGSSTLKFGLFSSVGTLNILKGKIIGIGTAGCLFSIENEEKQENSCDPADINSVEKGAALIVQWLRRQSYKYRITGIGHRVVHGGLKFSEPQLIDNALINELKKLEPLAPLHMPDTVTIVSSFMQAFPDTLQVACFDTAFHQQMPFEARHYAIPRGLWQQGIVRFGFHGISCEYIYRQLQQTDTLSDSKKIIIAHLGSGSSMTAIKDGHSIENTMGFSPAGGLMMNTRGGDIDPGVISYLLEEKRMKPDHLSELFNKESGLKAVAGSGDSMEQLLEKEKTDTKAAEAILMYCYFAKKKIGALAAAMGGLDILVFTGGIGEHSPVIRKRICKDLEFLGIQLNDELNDSTAENISELPSRVQVYVIPTNEEIIIAQHVKNYL